MPVFNIIITPDAAYVHVLLPINLGASLALQEAADSFLRTDGDKRGGIHKFIKRYQATGCSYRRNHGDSQ